MAHCEHRHYGFANLPSSPFHRFLHTGLHRRSISPPSVFPPGHQHVVDCFCFPAASLGVFLKCWSFFCVTRLFSNASCESSESHCVFSHLEANGKRDEFMLSFLPPFVSVRAAEPDPLSPVHLGYERQAVSCI